MAEIEGAIGRHFQSLSIVFVCAVNTKLASLWATKFLQIYIWSSLFCPCAVETNNYVMLLYTFEVENWLNYSYFWRCVGCVKWNTKRGDDVAVNICVMIQPWNWDWKVLFQIDAKFFFEMYLVRICFCSICFLVLNPNKMNSEQIDFSIHTK